MKILIGLTHFKNYTGSETHVYCLAKELVRRGHEVHIFAYEGYGAPMVDDVLDVRYWDRHTIQGCPKDFDILHLQHVIPTVYVLDQLSEVPVVTTHHGIIEAEWPVRNARIMKHICVSEEVKNMIEDMWEQCPGEEEIPSDVLTVVPNFIDLEKYTYKPSKEIGLNFLWAGTVSWFTLQSMYASINITSKIPGGCLTIIANWQHKCGIPEGAPVICYGPRRITSELLSQYSLVFGKGRVALESVATGVPVCIMGKDGSDGLLVKENMATLAKANFSGRTRPDIYSEEMCELYAQQLREFLSSPDIYWRVSSSYKKLIRTYDVKVVGGNIEKVYEEAINNHKS